jgi:hypothetical protein
VCMFTQWPMIQLADFFNPILYSDDKIVQVSEGEALSSVYGYKVANDSVIRFSNPILYSDYKIVQVSEVQSLSSVYGYKVTSDSVCIFLNSL